MKTSKYLAYVMAGTFALAGCGDDDNSGDDDATADAAVAGTPDAFVAPQGSLTVTWGPVTVPSGFEDTQCVVKRLGNTETFKAHTIHNVLGSASHHLIVYKTNETVERPDAFPCDPFTDTLNPEDGAPLVITQKSEETLELPEGVAFELEANQMIRLELHHINTTDDPIDLTVTSTFTPIPEADFVAAADIVFMGDVNINVPAGGSASLGPTYIPLPAELSGSNFFAVTGHQHQWGTNVTVEASAGNQAGTMVYDVPDFNWEEPETVRYNPEFQVPNNGGFRITCDWANQSGSNASFGEGVNDEMCFFWAYYWPSKGPRVCFAHSGFGITTCCPGGQFCDQLGNL